MSIMTDYLEVASNPMAPDNFVAPNDTRGQKLSNSDFRKLLMTPRPATSNQAADTGKRIQHDHGHAADKSEHKRRDAEAANMRHKRHHGKHKREHVKENATEQTPRYRDRAKERRDGKLAAPAEDAREEGEEEEEEEALNRSADYRAVAPSTAAGASHAERRRVLIQESKYLGGDMEHTHLVKGLDYVLLQKVRLEIQNKELEADQILDDELSKPEMNKDSSNAEDGIQFRSRLAANICDVLFNQKELERNEYFQPGRMAYRVELEDDSVDFEVPATVIRSKSDCYQLDGREPSAISTNEIVINKLTQILSYLRAGKRHAKKARMKGRLGERDELNHPSYPFNSQKGKATGGDIFDGVGTDYVPTTNQRARQLVGADGRKDALTNAAQDESIKNANVRLTSATTTDRAGGPMPKSTYFDAPADADADGSLGATKEFMQELSQRFGDDEKNMEKASLERFAAKTKVTCYDECYPGLAASFDAMGDSDDETDFSKMDLGSKKGPVGRWDFETQEEYSDYMSNKEALPKAAFQYGVKMADGRRTRRLGPKDEKAELDRQLQKIQSLIHKRKHLADDLIQNVPKKPRH